jgi:26S proteasome regulatory subunit (ATPase 3-interacting protein)
MLQERLDKLKNGTVLIPPEKRKRANQDYDTNRVLWKKRKGMVCVIYTVYNEYIIVLIDFTTASFYIYSIL